MAKVMPTADNSAAKWAQRMAASGDAMRAGAMAVTQSPGQAAAAKKDLWLANLNASAGRWAERVAAVSTSDWQNAYVNKGIPRIQQGAAQSQDKFKNFMAAWLAYEQTAVQSLPPRGNLEQNIARAVALMHKNAEAKGRFRQTGRAR